MNNTIIPRTALPNPHIPAYVNGMLVWGQLPQPSQSQFMAAAGPSASSAAPASETTGLPEDITCVGTTGSQTCGLAAVYCCSGPDPLSPTIPDHWPPSSPQLAPSSESPTTELSAASTNGTQVTFAPLPPAANGSGGGSGGAGASGSSSSSGSGSSSTWIAGVVAGVGAAAVISAGGSFLLVRRRCRQRGQQEHKLLVAAQSDPEDSKPCNGQPPPRYPPASGGSGRSMAPPGGAGAQLTAVLVASTQRSLVGWGPGSGPASGSDAGSVHSSPSRQSQLPLLLNRQDSRGRSQLVKFPSGMSGISSSHDNPIFESEGDMPARLDPGEPLPQHVAHWGIGEGGGARATVAAAAAAATAAAASAPGGPCLHRVIASDGPGHERRLSTEQLRFLEQKAATGREPGQRGGMSMQASVEDPSVDDPGWRGSGCRDLV